MDYRYAFEDRKKSNKKKIIFIIISLIVILLFTGIIFKDSSNAVVNKVSNIIISPLKGIHKLTLKISDSVNKKFADSAAVTEENDKLVKENEELKLKLLESQKILDENETLKEMLNIKTSYQHFKIALGKIILREHDNWTKTFTIDVGSNDGIKLNQAVVHKDGLVGFISNVSEKKSVVTTILDPQTSVSVNISTINEPAILKGDLELKEKNQLKLESIPIEAEVSIADMLYTSGLGSKFPSSIPVGKITEVISKKNDMNRYAIVEPTVEISKISEVGVIIN